MSARTNYLVQKLAICEIFMTLVFDQGYLFSFFGFPPISFHKVFNDNPSWQLFFIMRFLFSIWEFLEEIKLLSACTSDGNNVCNKTGIQNKWGDPLGSLEI